MFERERGLLGKDIQDAIFSIFESRASSEDAPAEEGSNDNDDDVEASTAKHRRRGAASFIMNAQAQVESEGRFFTWSFYFHRAIYLPETEGLFSR